MRIFFAIVILGFASWAMAQTQQQGSDPIPRSPGSGGKAQASVHSDGESSSRDTIIDLSPPPNDAAKHPESSSAEVDPDSEVIEVKKWDPHRAEKDIEVGDYYF